MELAKRFLTEIEAALTHIGQHPGTEDPGNNEIAHETEDAREQGHAADCGEGFKQIHLVCRAARQAR